MIFLHGLGDTAQDYVDLFRKNGLCPSNCKIVLPTAPTSSVTISNGDQMPSWYDLLELPEDPIEVDMLRNTIN